MKSKLTPSNRTPNRVHVVRPPAQDDYIPASTQRQNTEIVRVLAQISDKLKRSEAERFELLNELREYRKNLKDLEEKSKQSQKNVLALETEIKSKNALDTQSTQRQLRVEKQLKEAEEKLMQTIAGQALIDQRLNETENKHLVLDQRIDESITEQARLNRQHELAVQDKSRLVRKVERLEELLLETKDSLKSQNTALLTSQNTKIQPTGATALRSPIYTQESVTEQISSSWGGAWTDAWADFKPSKNLIRGASLAVLIGALGMIAWGIYSLVPVAPSKQQTQISQNNIATPDIVNSTASKDQVLLETLTQDPIETAVPKTIAATTTDIDTQTPNNALSYSDAQLLDALNNDAEQLATELNAIEPAKAHDNIIDIAPVEKQAYISLSAITESFKQKAYIQDPVLDAEIKKKLLDIPLATRLTPDDKLSKELKSLEDKAYKGDARAQHDLAAIYTAGQGTTQNFERAAFWFRQAADKGIANAAYNLGVLNHQGLGTEKNMDKAIYWYREASLLGHGEASYNLGIAHIEKIGTSYDPQLAAGFFESAANNGVTEAAYNLGLIYENGLTGEVNYDLALLWYKIAADNNTPQANKAIENIAKTLQIDVNDVENMVTRLQKIEKDNTGKILGPHETNKAKSPTLTKEDLYNSALVAQIQEYLMLTGLYTGPADGIYGPNTADAIKKFQQSRQIEVDGKISETLLSTMLQGTL